MIEILIQILAVSIPIVFLIDFAGAAEKIKKWLFYRIYSPETEYEWYELKPFDCSACLSVWVYWIVFGILGVLQQQLLIYFLYLLIQGFATGLMSILIKNKILL